MMHVWTQIQLRSGKPGDGLSVLLSCFSCLLRYRIDHTWSMTGHTSTADFYENTNPMRVIDKIREPFLCLNAEDDPLCVGENISENLHIFDDREHNAAIAVTKTGSHCAFYELSPFNASIFPSSWSEKVLFQFFESVLRHADHMVTPAAS